MSAPSIRPIRTGPIVTDLLSLHDPFDRVSVLLPLPLDAAYDYKADPALALECGDVVEVPLGQRRMIGVVLGPGGDESVPEERLRPVIRRLDTPRLPKTVIDLVDWTAAWTLAPRGAVVRMAISTPSAFDRPSRASCIPPARRPTGQARHG